MLSKKIGSVLFFLLAIASCSDSAEIIKNIKQKEDGQNRYFVLFQSVDDDTLWYAGQVKPQVLMREADGLSIPEISLIRYQRRDVKDPTKLHQGAIFRMHLSLGPGEESFKPLLEKAQRKLPDKPARLSAVPFAALKLCLQKPDGKEVELKAETLAGISGQKTSQNVGFSINFDQLETELVEALLNGNTGVKYHLYYNYKYSQPKAGDGQSPPASDQREFDRKNPDKPEDSRNLPGQRDFDQINRQAEEKVGWEMAGQGFVGFSEYDENIRKQCVLIESNPDEWTKAYLTLPLIQPPKGIDIDSIDLKAEIVAGKKSFEKSSFSWTPKKGWRDEHGAPLVYAFFDLTEVKKQVEDLSQTSYRIKQKIISNKKDTLEQEFNTELLVGNAPVSSPLELAETFEIDTGFLTWSSDSRQGLHGIEVKLTDGKWKSERTIEAEFKNGKLSTPASHRWLIPVSEENSESDILEAEIFFVIKKDNKEEKIPWELNGKNLRKELPGMSCFFFDQDWSNK